ncbi:MAG: cob(I)yrinic acid a,c-diamide adenosyltransferase [Acidimicrobiia bacterium]
MREFEPTPDRGTPKGTNRAPSLVLVNTGDGKGKSTAAFGTMIRAVARGWRVAVVQFLKSGDWHVGEEKVAVDLGVDWHAIGDGFTWDSKDMDESQAIAIEAWNTAREIIEAGAHRLVLLDEITYPMNWGWISTEDVIATIRDRPEQVSVICTGRDAPELLIEIADTVTEMRNVKHAYDAGIMARRGIDY